MKRTIKIFVAVLRLLTSVIFLFIALNCGNVDGPVPPPCNTNISLEQLPMLRISCISPMDSDCVRPDLTVSGTVSGLPTAFMLRVFAKEQTSSSWSLRGPAIIGQDSSWAAHITVGTTDKEGKFFQLAVVGINQQQRSEIESSQCQDKQFNINNPIPLLITVKRDSIGDRELGIYSETSSDRIIDSFIGSYVGGGARIDTFIDDNTSKIEGGISKKTTLSVDGSRGGYAGWFVQWGLSGTPDSYSKDMSAFVDGKLTFWVKSGINLLVGIRSGNIYAGTENSTVLLNSYPSFQADNEWHRICIPISDFTKADPRTDLKKIKIFFNVASNTPSGGTGGIPKTFWIDDVRWEKRCKPTNDCF